MNVTSMHTAFQIGVDKVSSLNYPGFEPEEIDFILNQAQDRFVKTRYGRNNTYRKGFEETQKRTDDIRNIVKNAIIVPAPSIASNKPNGQYVTLPNTATDIYWFAVEEEVSVTTTDCNGNRIVRRLPVKPITHDVYNNIIKDPFNKPFEDEVIRLANEGFFELITIPSITINQYLLRYVRQPRRIDLTTSVDCELSEHTHQEIVDIACGIALEGIESKRFQTNTIETSKQE